MNTNWKEDIRKAIEVGLSTDYNDQALKQFISTEIIEKLIEDIKLPEYEHKNCPIPQTCIGYQNADSDLDMVKQQLKSKWL